MTRVLPRRGLRAVLSLLLVALLAGACSENEGDGAEVGEFLDETELLSHRFVYTETTPSGGVTTVKGIIEDDFRRRALLSVEGTPVLEQVVYDDLAAVRFFEGDRLGRYLDKEVVSFVETDTDTEGIDVFTALQSGNWVIDPAGAPPQITAVDDATINGVDPIYDATVVLDEVRALTKVFDGEVFERYSETSLSPTYRKDEDPFPAPEDGSDVVRYDVGQAEMPRNVEGGQLQILEEFHFMKFAVYVKDGKIIRVSKDIGLAPTVLKNFETYMVQLINETAPADVRAGFEATVEALEGQELGQFLLDALNTIRDLQGDDPIRFRSTTYELLDLGAADIAIEPPVDGIEADLAVMLNLGVKPPVPESDGDGVGDDDTDAGVDQTAAADGASTDATSGADESDDAAAAN